MLAWAICGACSRHTVADAWLGTQVFVSLRDELPCFLMALFVLYIFLTTQLQEESSQPQTLPGCFHRQNEQQGHFQKWQHSLQVCGRMYLASGKVGAGGSCPVVTGKVECSGCSGDMVSLWLPLFRNPGLQLVISRGLNDVSLLGSLRRVLGSFTV